MKISSLDVLQNVRVYSDKSLFSINYLSMNRSRLNWSPGTRNRLDEKVTSYYVNLCFEQDVRTLKTYTLSTIIVFNLIFALMPLIEKAMMQQCINKEKVTKHEKTNILLMQLLTTVLD